MQNQAPMRVAPVSGDEFVAYARTASVPLPIEQTPLWDTYDSTVPGRKPWRRLAVFAAEAATPSALIALTEYPGSRFRYVWAKHGPVWLTAPTATDEAALRAALVDYVKAADAGIDFVRLHASDAAADLRPLLQTVTYDLTVVIDLTAPPEERLAALSKNFRYEVRKALGHETTVVTDETGLDRAAFDELYAVYLETAQRDSFGIYGADVYFAMLTALGDAARVYVARRADAGADGDRTPGRAVAWLIATEWDGLATYYFAAGTGEARETGAAIRLLWDASEALRARGATALDLMGVDSPRAPSLAGVGTFKRKWGPEVEVDGAWDLPIHPWKYRALALALRVKRLIRR